MEQVWHCLAIKLQRQLFKSSCNLTAAKNVTDYCEKARAKLVKTGLKGLCKFQNYFSLKITIFAAKEC